jgi:hypothetical protein
MQLWCTKSCGFFGSGRLRKYDGAPTNADTLRSGEQAALASDLLAPLDALAIPKAVVNG